MVKNHFIFTFPKIHSDNIMKYSNSQTFKLSINLFTIKFIMLSSIKLKVLTLNC